MSVWDGEAVRQGVIEAALASYLTDGHYNGIAIGVRNIDPIVFRLLADLGLIRTVFPVRGTGDTWSLGSYFNKRFSEEVLRCLEGPRKPYLLIKSEVLDDLNVKELFRWVVEFEGSQYISRWGDRLLLCITITQYEAVEEGLLAKPEERIRFSVKDTRELIDEGIIKPSRLWLDHIMEEIRYLIVGGALKYCKSYQVDATPKNIRLAHNYQLYIDCKTNPSLARALLEDVTLKNTWKHMTARIMEETISAYARKLIDYEDVKLVKRVINCSVGGTPQKGPYNEYVISRLQQILDLIMTGDISKYDNRLTKLNKLIEYFTNVRRKSLRTLRQALSATEWNRVWELSEIIESLKTILNLEGSTPRGCVILVSIHAAA